jgi:hypothetical protein
MAKTWRTALIVALKDPERRTSAGKVDFAFLPQDTGMARDFYYGGDGSRNVVNFRKIK